LSVVIAPATRARLHEKIADNQSFLVKAIGSIQFGFR